MEIVINIDSEEPLFAQVVEQIKTGVRGQRLKAGDPLPSIRQLASDLGVNNKTIAKAYRLLERDNIIVTRGYRGTFIHDEAGS
ncbi:GntR family transcriptional regulator, partial [Kordiimonas sp.]|uniref:GntR family transcriptional regulator n=1 Tax=Kordiimonas sp. TaxID=1970157 RepID=UPI003A930461